MRRSKLVLATVAFLAMAGLAPRGGVLFARSDPPPKTAPAEAKADPARPRTLEGYVAQEKDF